MPVRRNIVTNAAARTAYVNGVIALKAQFTGVTTSMLGITGPPSLSAHGTASSPGTIPP